MQLRRTMFNESIYASGATLATAGQTPHAEPNLASSNITQAEAGVEWAIQFNDFEASDHDSEEDGRAEDDYSVGLSDDAKELSLHAGHRSNPRGVDACVVNERDEEEVRS